ncbi:LysR family transcriptional regulator [Saccharospirillum sp. MSK14-1]|uniref:LysR family transcriptional regulator n=1 Tax=Saccharospirillum sp. MSK14-1 TaxID=1897632 RepID=UPI000D3C428B|nr:LysR family transcriptional regulator [Saccharospirillum sp. MSK14-1]PTY37765.1 LysR family transcriptional regulator [Saccharospirillum sp. MSK14-1]
MPTSIAKTNNLFNWDDFKTIHAIVLTGSLSGAARRLEVSHATVFRRLNIIEKRLGVALFERHPGGYQATAAGEEMAAVAAKMDSEVQAAERRLIGRDLQLAGTVRLTTTDSLLSGVLTPILADFRHQHPAIKLEVVAPSQTFNLSKREADLALRPANQPPENLVGRRVGHIRQAIYLASEKADKALAQALDGTALWQQLDWIGPDANMGYHSLQKWLHQQGLEQRCRYWTDTTLAMQSAARHGLGAAVLPCYLAQADAGLTQLGEPITAMSTQLWLLTHPDLRHSARVRALMDHLAEALRTHPDIGIA